MSEVVINQPASEEQVIINSSEIAQESEVQINSSDVAVEEQAVITMDYLQQLMVILVQTRGFKEQAEAYNTSAGTYASNASTYADNANTYASNAAAYATSASTYASNANTYKVAAKGEADRAERAEERAKNYQNNASTYSTQAKGYRDEAKYYSENVNVFVPAVDDSGNISWTNSAGLDNPTTKNIKGPKGDTGEPGVYIGTDTPDGYNVYINPNEILSEGLTLSDFLTYQLQMKAYFEQIKAKLDGGSSRGEVIAVVDFAILDSVTLL